MKYFELLALHFFLLSTAVAEPALARGGPVHPPPPEQRRTELRSVLQERWVPVSEQPAERSGQPRRLSDQDRADLRLQLRRQRQHDFPPTP
jgi:hypothetical protein